MDQSDNDSRSKEIDFKKLNKQKNRPSIRIVDLKDRQEIYKWIEGHKLVGFTGLPRVGFMSDTVACFINRGECGIATLDHLVKKPGSTDNTLEGVYCVMACIEYAKANGFKVLHGFTEVEHISQISELLGFKQLPHKYLVMEL